MNHSIFTAIGAASILVISAPIHAETIKESEARAKQVILSLAKDPSSVKWQKISISENKHHACLTLNSKNSYGAYTGFLTYRMMRRDGSLSWLLLQGSERDFASHQACVEFITKMNFYDSPEGQLQLELEGQQRKQKEAEQWKQIDELSKTKS